MKMTNCLIMAESLGNIGDLALLLQTSQILRERGIQNLSIWQWNKNCAEIETQIEQQLLKTESGLKIRNLLKKKDLIIFGGGQVVRNNCSLPCLTTILLHLTINRIRGAKVYFISIGVSDISGMRRLLWRIILSMSAHISTRDPTSKINIQNILEKPSKISIENDLFLYESKFTNLFNDDSQKNEIAISPCIDSSEGRAFDMDAVVKCASNLSRKHTITNLSILAHDARDGADEKVCNEMRVLLSKEMPNCSIKTIKSSNLEDYADAYRKSRYVITNRLHAALMGLTCHSKVAIIQDNNPKLNDLQDRFKLPSLETIEFYDTSAHEDTIAIFQRERGRIKEQISTLPLG